MEFTFPLHPDHVKGTCGQVLKRGKRQDQPCGRRSCYRVRGVSYCSVHYRRVDSTFSLYLDEDCWKSIFNQVLDVDKWPLLFVCKLWLKWVGKVRCREPLLEYRKHHYDDEFLRWAYRVLPCNERCLSLELDIGGKLDLAEIVLSRGYSKVPDNVLDEFVRFGGYRFWDCRDRAIQVGKLLIDRGNQLQRVDYDKDKPGVLTELLTYHGS
jgi:hypothetical protein